MKISGGRLSSACTWESTLGALKLEVIFFWGRGPKYQAGWQQGNAKLHTKAWWASKRHDTFKQKKHQGVKDGQECKTKQIYQILTAMYSKNTQIICCMKGSLTSRFKRKLRISKPLTCSIAINHHIILCCANASVQICKRFIFNTTNQQHVECHDMKAFDSSWTSCQPLIEQSPNCCALKSVHVSRTCTGEVWNHGI